jgi:glycosyltransferase involved in cell wall biosynthesis
MARLGIFVGEENWTFFHELYDYLVTHFQTDVFTPKTYQTPLLYGRLNRWAFRRRMAAILRHNDVCFFEWASDYLMHASHMPKQCTIVTRLHSFELFDWAPRINWNPVDKVILVSQAMQRQFVDLYPEHEHRTVVVYNGRPLEAFRPFARTDFNLTIGMLCNIKPIKRIYEVVLMLSELRAKGYDARLRIAGRPEHPGDFRYAAAIHRLVDTLDLHSYVTFDDYVTETPAWLQQIDIFISNSYWEGQQVALLEAMATGCYCLSHAWAGAEEMLPEENLFMTDSELQRKIIEYSKTTQPEKELLQAKMRSIALEKFNVDKTKVQIRQVVEEAYQDWSGKNAVQ